MTAEITFFEERHQTGETSVAVNVVKLLAKFLRRQSGFPSTQPGTFLNAASSSIFWDNCFQNGSSMSFTPMSTNSLTLVLIIGGEGAIVAAGKKESLDRNWISRRNEMSPGWP